MGVTLREGNPSSFNPSWAVAGGGVGVFSRFSEWDSLADLVMVTCTQSWFPGVPGVELFNGDVGIFEVFGGVPGFVVFWRITCPLGTVLEVVSV